MTAVLKRNIYVLHLSQSPHEWGCRCNINPIHIFQRHRTSSSYCSRLFSRLQTDECRCTKWMKEIRHMVIYPCAYFDAYLHLECRLKMFDHFPLIKKKKRREIKTEQLWWWWVFSRFLWPFYYGLISSWVIEALASFESHYASVWQTSQALCNST